MPAVHAGAAARPTRCRDRLPAGLLLGPSGPSGAHDSPWSHHARPGRRNMTGPRGRRPVAHVSDVVGRYPQHDVVHKDAGRRLPSVQPSSEAGSRRRRHSPDAPAAAARQVGRGRAAVQPAAGGRVRVVVRPAPGASAGCQRDRRCCAARVPCWGVARALPDPGRGGGETSRRREPTMRRLAWRSCPAGARRSSGCVTSRASTTPCYAISSGAGHRRGAALAPEHSGVTSTDRAVAPSPRRRPWPL
jgi:hypothetical protein